jgi:hypothetical protein
MPQKILGASPNHAWPDRERLLLPKTFAVNSLAFSMKIFNSTSCCGGTILPAQTTVNFEPPCVDLTVFCSRRVVWLMYGFCPTRGRCTGISFGPDDQVQIGVTLLHVIVGRLFWNALESGIIALYDGAARTLGISSDERWECVV